VRRGDRWGSIARVFACSRWWPYKSVRRSQADAEDHDGRYGSGPAFTHTGHTHTEDAVGLLSKTTRSMNSAVIGTKNTSRY